ncbi:MAG: choline-sulfatase [Methylobacteriaceae bacterium]|nr:choline-sulfatase [Methylobacteriaceae bacterium]
MPAEKPNILLIVADQLAAPFLPCYGHRVVKAPHIERLAADGVIFANAYTNSPLCAPARATLMTGGLPSRTAVYDNAAEFRSSIPTFAHYLRLEGYRTCLSGKMHFVGPDQLHGFEERLTTDIYPADFGWTPDWSRPGERIDWWYHNMTSVKEAGVAEITNQLEYDDEVAFLARRRLYDFARASDTLPFCLTVSFTHPHDPYIARPKYWNLYRDEDIDAPATDPVPYANMDAHGCRLHDMSAMCEHEIAEADVLAARHGYYAAISYVDDHIGALLATLEACNFAENTSVILTSDHGDFLGERGLWYKMSFREHAARVPLIVHARGRFRPSRVATPVAIADVLPTLVDLARPGASSALAAPIDGRSLLPALQGSSADPQATVLGEYLAEGVCAPMVMVRQGRWKFIACGDDPDQLFDLEADPHENRNLAADPAWAAEAANLRAIVAARFDREAIRRDVMASQKARLSVFKALTKGKVFPWDYQPLRLAAEQYTRNHREVTATDVMSRYPPMKAERQ